MTQEALVYPEPDGTATSGHSGTDTSHERALAERNSGTIARRQQWVAARLARMRGSGITVKELREDSGMHHGQASATLSNMHKAGRLLMLTEKRDRCHVYVLPEHAGDRETVAPGETRGRNPLATLTAENREDLEFQAWSAGYQAAAGEAVDEATLRTLFNIYWKDAQ